MTAVPGAWQRRAWQSTWGNRHGVMVMMDFAERLRSIETAIVLATKVVAPDFDAESPDGASALMSLGVTVAPLLARGGPDDSGDLLLSSLQEEIHLPTSAEALQNFRDAASDVIDAGAGNQRLIRAIALGLVALDVLDLERGR